MKNHFYNLTSCILIVLGITGTTLAQEMDPEVVNKIGKTICDCLEEKGTDNVEVFAENLDKCFETTLSMEKELNDLGLHLDDSGDVFVVSASVVMYLMGNCDLVLKLSNETFQAETKADTISKIKPDQNCKSFFQGKFVSLDTDMPIYTTMTGDIQLVEYELTNTYAKYKLIWIGPCEYKLQFIEGDDEMSKKYVELYGDTASVEILEINENDIVFLTKLDGQSYNNNMRKVE